MGKRDGFEFKLAFRPSLFSVTLKPKRIRHYTFNFWWLGVNLFFEWMRK